MFIREEAFPFAAPIAVLGAVLVIVGYWAAALLVLAAALCVALFFRDPERIPPPGASLLLSPADGRVISAGIKGGRLKISVFMSVFNVHVNRAPVQGEVERVLYNPGKFFAAWNEKASMDNEQVCITFRAEEGLIDVVMIAGLIARRIVCWARPGMKFERAERIGLIRFGSRLDLYLSPQKAEAVARVGDRVRAGVTPLAAWKGKER